MSTFFNICEGVNVDMSFPHLIPTKIVPVVQFVKDSIDSIDRSRKPREANIVNAGNLGHPRISPIMEDRCLIQIDARGDDEFQWLYQFSHEYMHNFIGGPLSGSKTGLWWFEEILCCTSSLYHISLWACHLGRSLHTVPAGQEYPFVLGQDALCSFLAHDRKPDETPRQLIAYLQSGLLSREGYHPSDYNTFSLCARQILPLFLDNPHLWRIAAHIGDSRQYPTLGELFSVLRRSADPAYLQSIDEMIALLFP